VSPARLSTRAAAAGLAGIAGVHVAWAAGSSWPLADRAALADAVIGRRGGQVPSPAACLLVAGLLATAAALVGGEGSRGSPPRRIGAGAVVGILAARAGCGLAGRTDILSPGSCSPRFRELDRRIYSPLCLALATLALPAAVPERADGAGA
jgi:hypothetical protein